MSFLTGPTPPKTDLEIVLDFLFEAIEGWSAQFRTTDINRKMYEAAQAFQRMKAASNGTLGAEHSPIPEPVGGVDGEETKAERRGEEDDPVLEAKKLAARERMAKARAARMRNIAEKKNASGSRI